MLKIWGRANSINVQKVMWTVGELELAYEQINIGGAFGGLDTEAYGQMNPNRRIPTLQDGETIIWESQSIVRYLAATYGAGTLWPEDPSERALADRWMDWTLTTIMPHLFVTFWGLIRTPEADRDLTAIGRATEQLGQIWPILDAHLSQSRYVAGPHLSMGDVPLGCAWWRYINLDIERPPLANIQLWYQNLKAKPAYQKHVMIPLS